MNVVCDWCHKLHDLGLSWPVTREEFHTFTNPENKETHRYKVKEEHLYFCKHAHRNEYLYGL